MAQMPGADEMRIDDLAHRSGVAGTTIRLYTTRGLLPPPRLEGRTGYYDDRHLARLQLIRELQGRGFSLAAIKELLDARAEGRDLAELFAGPTEFDAVFGGEALVLTPAELAARFPTDTIGPSEMQRVARLGFVALLDDGRIRVADRRFVETGAALVAMGVPIDAVLDELETLAGETDTIAARFIDVFATYLYEASSNVDEMRAHLAQLRLHAQHVVGATLESSLARLGAQRFADELREWESVEPV
jgi:DNA-binding transcriptional MerR regulator